MVEPTPPPRPNTREFAAWKLATLKAKLTDLVEQKASIGHQIKQTLDKTMEWEEKVEEWKQTTSPEDAVEAIIAERKKEAQ